MASSRTRKPQQQVAHYKYLKVIKVIAKFQLLRTALPLRKFNRAPVHLAARSNCHRLDGATERAICLPIIPMQRAEDGAVELVARIEHRVEHQVVIIGIARHSYPVAPFVKKKVQSHP